MTNSDVWTFAPTLPLRTTINRNPSADKHEDTDPQTYTHHDSDKDIHT